MAESFGRTRVTLASPLLRLRLSLPLFVMLAALAGCTHEVVPTSGPHTAVPGNQVKIYQKPPAKYEVLGRVDVQITPQLAPDDKGETNAAFDLLKSKAGAMGATGILLEITSDNEYDHVATTGYHRQFYQVLMRNDPRMAMADAIFVVKE